MRSENKQKIESHLDEQLGMWTRLLPWRRELVAHLEEAYQVAQDDSRVDDAWQHALAEFGDVQEVASQLKKEHWPQYVGWRLLAVIVAAMIVFSIVRFSCFLDLPAVGFTLGPVIALVVFDLYRGSIRWEVARRVGSYGGLCGAIIGMVFLLADITNPSNVGASLAATIMCALYCVLLFTPSPTFVIAMIGIAVIELSMLVYSFGHLDINETTNAIDAVRHSLGSVEVSFVMRMLAICGAGICAGIARFGFMGIARHAVSLGAGAFLISLVLILSKMSDPNNLVSQLLVAFSTMVLVVAGSHCVSDASRMARRLLL